MENSLKSKQFVDVIVIGAGVSGLSAACKLLQTDSNLTILVLEAKGRIGGRTLGLELKGANGNERFDLGGQWVGSCQPHVMELLEDLSLEVCPQYITGKKVMQLGSSEIRTYNATIPSLSWLSLIDLYRFMNKMERWRKKIPINDPASCPYAKEWDSMTFEQALRKYVWTKGARDTVEATGRCMFGVEPKDMSLFYFLYYAQAAGGVEKLISSEKNMGNEFKVKGGTFQICEKLCEKIGKERILLNHPVVEINQEEHEVYVKTSQGSTFVCDRVILALPPHQAAKVEFVPALPIEKIYVLQRMPVGYLTKIVVTYKKAFWREQGYSGEHVSNGGRSKHGRCESGPLNIGFDATTFNGNPALVTFIGGDQQREYAKLQPNERKAAVLQSLAEFFGVEALECIDYGEKNWNEEAYNGGCPVSVATPGVISLIAPGLRQPFNRLHFAGTESATVWCGFLSGAVQAGHRAAHEVLYNIRPSSISAGQLEDTYYNMRHHRPHNLSQCMESQTRKTFHVYRILIPIAGVVVTAVVFRKMLFALAFNRPS